MANSLTNLKINEVSFCKKGMNKHARISLFKSADDSVATEIKKYYSSYDSAETSIDFKTILNLNDKRQKLWAAKDKLYPLFEALNSSITSTVSDTNLSDSGRSANIEQSVADFLAAVKAEMPDVEEELSKMFKELNAGSSGNTKPDGDIMSAEEIKKAVDEAVAKATVELTEKLEKAEKEVLDFKAKAEEKKKKEDMAKSDEVIEFAGAKISKADVGDSQFAIFKAMADENAKTVERLAKAETEAELAKLEKRASEEFSHLPGTSAEKATLLKFLATDPEKGKSVEALMKSLDESNAKMFSTVGVNKGASVTEGRDAKIAEIQKRDGVAKHVAMEKAAVEAPELFK